MNLVSTQGLVLTTTPYGETSVIAKIFTRELGVRSYIIKGVRSRTGRMRQNMLQPLSSLDLVVYNNPKSQINHIREMSPRHNSSEPDAAAIAMRFFATEVLYRALNEADPLPSLFDFAAALPSSGCPPHLPITFLIETATHLGLRPMDNMGTATPFFDLDLGRYVPAAVESTLSLRHSQLLHQYLSSTTPPPTPLTDRAAIIDALLAYFHIHLSGFSKFHSHEILHSILQ